MNARRIQFVAGIIGLVCALVGAVFSYRLYRLISLQRAGMCDYLPCADSQTYAWLAVFLALTAIGMAVALLTLLRPRKSR